MLNQSIERKCKDDSLSLPSKTVAKTAVGGCVASGADGDDVEGRGRIVGPFEVERYGRGVEAEEFTGNGIGEGRVGEEGGGDRCQRLPRRGGGVEPIE